MPTTALEHVAVDAVVPSGQVADTIVAMVKGEDPPDVPKRTEPQPAHAGNPSQGEDETTICPDCGGVLTERVADGVHVWQCRVGHRYSAESLVDGQADDVEAALWAAIRALEDRSRLLERLANQFEARGNERTVNSFRRRASSAREQALIVRDALARATQLSLRRLASSEPDEVVQENAQ
jgi:two-component system chemotaxis response regulator CheB